jgi:hypothetical protein
MFENSNNYTNTLISNSSDEKKNSRNWYNLGDSHYPSYGHPWDNSETILETTISFSSFIISFSLNNYFKIFLNNYFLSLRLFHSFFYPSLNMKRQIHVPFHVHDIYINLNYI